MKYRHKGIEVNALQIPEKNNVEWVIVLGDAGYTLFYAQAGWWLVIDEYGCLRAVPPKEFAGHYEEAE